MEQQILQVKLNECKTSDNEEFLCESTSFYNQFEKCLKNPFWCRRSLQVLKSSDEFPEYHGKSGIALSTIRNCKITNYPELVGDILNRERNILFIPTIPKKVTMKCSDNLTDRRVGTAEKTIEFGIDGAEPVKILYDLGDTEYEKPIKALKFLFQEYFEWNGISELEELIFQAPSWILALNAVIPPEVRNMKGSTQDSLQYLLRFVKSLRRLPTISLIFLILTMILLYMVSKRVFAVLTVVGPVLMAPIINWVNKVHRDLKEIYTRIYEVCKETEKNN